MSFKITFIGAGSIGYTRGLLKDILSVREFRDIKVAFTDINRRKLDMVTRLCQRDIDSNGSNIKIESTTDRRESLRDAKYVFNVVRIGGLDAFKLDNRYPVKVRSGSVRRRYIVCRRDHVWTEGDRSRT
jgi:alpha-galactosidase